MITKKGFTLIELVVVIVILGVLAATAAPKFMDLQRDARIAVLDGLASAIKSAVNISQAKSITASGGGGCYVYTSKTNSFIMHFVNNGNVNSKCVAVYAPSDSFSFSTAFGIPTANVAGVISSLYGSDMQKKNGDLYLDSNFAELNYRANTVVKCSEKDVEYCYRWIRDSQVPGSLNGAPCSQTSCNWGSFYIIPEFGFLKYNGNTASIDDNASCAIRYDVRWKMDADGKGIGSEYRIVYADGGC